MSDMAIHQLESSAPNQGSKKRLKWILVFAGILCACIYAFKFYWLEHPVGDRTSWSVGLASPVRFRLE